MNDNNLSLEAVVDWHNEAAAELDEELAYVRFVKFLIESVGDRPEDDPDFNFMLGKVRGKRQLLEQHMGMVVAQASHIHQALELPASD